MEFATWAKAWGADFFFPGNGHPSLQSAIALDGLLEGLFRGELPSKIHGFGEMERGLEAQVDALIDFDAF